MTVEDNKLINELGFWGISLLFLLFISPIASLNKSINLFKFLELLTSTNNLHYPDIGTSQPFCIKNFIIGCS